MGPGQLMQNKEQLIKDKILSRFRQSAEFPAMANTVNLISKFNSSEDTSISQLANIILKDYALTSKSLKLVNSVYYSNYGEVTTISRAIILLGFENIRNVALTLMLFDHLQKNSLNTDLTDTMVKSLFSGILAQKMADDISFVDKEEAFICALFHAFGKMMVAFYLPEENSDIMRFSRERETSEDLAAASVIGISYTEIGMIIAKEWHFPEKIVNCMRKMRVMELPNKLSEFDKLHSITTISNEIAAILSTALPKEQKEEKIEKFLKPFKDKLGLSDSKVSEFITSSAQEIGEHAETFKLDLGKVRFAKELRRWSADAGAEVILADEAVSMDSLKSIDLIIEDKREATAETAFTKGIQDINSAILNNYALNDIIRIVLETMYRGMQLSGMSRVLFFIKDTKRPIMGIRFGFGSGIDELRKWFEVPLVDSNDIFNMAIMKQNDLVIKDIAGADIKHLIPQWYGSKISSQVFVVLLPIVINNKPIGMFYVEGEISGFQKISGGHLNYLKILRDQTVLAVKQKQGY